MYKRGDRFEVIEECSFKLGTFVTLKYWDGTDRPDFVSESEWDTAKIRKDRFEYLHNLRKVQGYEVLNSEVCA